MPYQIKIGASSNGQALFGSQAIKESSCGVDDTERAYGSQLAHRVVVLLPLTGKHIIITPTEARRLGYKITDTFKRPFGCRG